jgi:multidrug efflux system outer membrane protein
VVVRRAAAGLLLFALGGCAVGPDYKEPEIAVEGTFLGTPQNGFGAGSTVALWWRGFRDPDLDELIDRAIRASFDVRVAAARVRQARALRHVAQLELLPSTETSAGYTRNRVSQAAAESVGGTQATATNLYTAGFDATWELDFFGGARRAVEANTAEVGAAEAARDDALVTVLAEVARNYFELRGAQARLASTARNAESEHETLRLAEERLAAGQGSDLDTARARAQLDATLASAPPLEAEVARAIHRLGVLTGAAPTALEDLLGKPAPLPEIPPLVQIGRPADLLKRRPDVRFAERRLAAATARIGVAKADYFPRVVFGGSFGVAASDFAGLGRASNGTYSFGPSIRWSAFDLGRVFDRVEAADADTQAALATYERTVMTALEETEDTLVGFGRERARRDLLREAASASAEAATIARERYRAGVADFLTVIDAERAQLEAQDRLAESGARTAVALVALYKSLGGGWESAQAANDRP